MSQTETNEQAVPVSHFSSYKEDLEDLNKLASKAFAKDGSVKKATAAIDCLALARDGVRQLDATYKDLVAPIAKQLKPYEDERRVLKAGLEKVEAKAKDGLLKVLAEQHELPGESAIGTTLSIVLKPALKITDASLIGDEFLLPRAQCIDTAKLALLLKAQDAANKAAVAAGGVATLSTPGAELVNSVILSTRLLDALA